MTLWNILKKDIYCGIFKRKLLFLPVTAVIVILVITADLGLTRKLAYNKEIGAVSMGDLYQIFYKGSPLVDLENIRDVYISEQYIFMILCMMAVVGDYFAKDFSGVGLQIIVRCNDIKKWFASKILLCLIADLFVQMCVAASVIGVSLIRGYNLNLNVNMKILHMYGYSNDINSVASGDIFIMSIVLPFLSLLTMTLIQMLLSIIVSPAIGVLITSVVMIASVFYNNALLIFNGLMCKRNNIYLQAGATTLSMFLVDITVIVILCIGGCFYLSAVDKLGNKEQ